MKGGCDVQACVLCSGDRRMSNAEYGKKAIFKKGLFTIRTYVCDQNAPSGGGTTIYTESIKDLKKQMKEHYDNNFGDGNEGDESELAFEDNCRFSDFELGDGDDFIFADIVNLPNGIKIVKKGKRK